MPSNNIKMNSRNSDNSAKRIAALRAFSPATNKIQSSVSTSKTIHFIGFGTPGCKVLEYIYKQGISAKYTGIIEPGRLHLSSGIDIIPFSPPRYVRFKRGEELIWFSDMQQKLVVPEEIKQLFIADHRYILLAGLGGYTGTYMIEELSLFLNDSNKDFLAICSLPYLFEGRERKTNATNTFAKLRPSHHFKYLDLERLTKKYDHMSIKDAFEIADKEFYLVYKNSLGNI